MQRDLDALMDWGSTWGMKFNAKKCNIMRVSRSRKPLQHFYSLGNEFLQEVSDAKYLGIQIDNKLDWNKHISTVAARDQSKLAFLNRNLNSRVGESVCDTHLEAFFKRNFLALLRSLVTTFACSHCQSVSHGVGSRSFRPPSWIF